MPGEDRRCIARRSQAQRAATQWRSGAVGASSAVGSMAANTPGSNEADTDHAHNHATDGDGSMGDNHAHAQERRDEARRRKGRNCRSTRVAAVRR